MHFFGASYDIMKKCAASVARSKMQTVVLSQGQPLARVFLDFSPASETEELVVVLKSGEHAGVDKGRIFYDLPNPLTIRGESGVAGDCVLRSENCEAFHKDTENRAVITFGGNCTRVTLRGFTIENTHVKAAGDVRLGNQAEALCWHNKTGFLYCEDMAFVSRQDTIHVKGFSHFKSCFVSGDVDFIWGYCHTSLFDGCTIHVREDNRGAGCPAYVLQSRALNSTPGFVFVGCEFTAEGGTERDIFIARTEGTGRKDSADRWDSVALVDCTVSSLYNAALWTDEGGTRAVYPQKGSALCGWREFGTKIRGADGAVHAYDASLQDRHGYSMDRKDLELLRRAVEQAEIARQGGCRLQGV